MLGRVGPRGRYGPLLECPRSQTAISRFRPVGTTGPCARSRWDPDPRGRRPARRHTTDPRRDRDAQRARPRRGRRRVRRCPRLRPRRRATPRSASRSWASASRAPARSIRGRAWSSSRRTSVRTSATCRSPMMSRRRSACRRSSTATRTSPRSARRPTAQPAASDFIYLTVSTGVGGSIVTDGRLFHGPDGMAGELGHLPVELDGPRCGCGGAATSRRRVRARRSRARRARRSMAGSKPIPRGACRRRSASPSSSADDVAAGEEAGDPTCGELMQPRTSCFAAACVGYVNAFNPHLIIIGGAIAEAQGERLFGPAQDTIAARASRARRRGPRRPAGARRRRLPRRRPSARLVAPQRSSLEAQRPGHPAVVRVPRQ